MQTLLLVAGTFIAIALIVFVLLQRSEGGGLGMGGGSGGSMGGPVQPARRGRHADAAPPPCWRVCSSSPSASA